MHQNHTNFDTENGTPVAAGDRYWAHDLLRDFHYTRGLAGLLGKALLGNDLVLAGGETIVKSGNSAATIGEVYGICKATINVPDDAVDWQIPKAYKPDEIYLVVCARNKTVSLPNGNGTLRLRYKATNGSERPRLFATGSYAYFQTDDAEVIADNSAAAATELVIAHYFGAGSNLVIIPIATRLQKIDNDIVVAVGDEKAEREDAEAAEATAREDADNALQAAIDAKPDVDLGLLHLKVTNNGGTTSVLNTITQPYISGTVNVNGSAVNISLTAVPTPSVAGLYYVTISSAGAVSTSSATPTWNGDKRGFYSSTARSVLRFYYTGANGGAYYTNKMILEREEDLTRQNENAILPISSGYLMPGTTTVNTVLSGNLVAGAYRLEVAGGKGGAGAVPNTSNNGGAGGMGANGNVLTDTIILDKTTYFKAYIGGDGKDGDPSSYTGHGGGGPGGASGLDSLLVLYDVSEVVKEMIALGGSGGGGGQNNNIDGGGGGDGGSRYGTGNNGYNHNNTTLDGGYGGNCNQLTTGGAGRYSGGNGGVGGYSGNDYTGQKGAWGHGNGNNSNGGAGGAKTQVDITIFPNRKDAYGNSDPVTYSLISAGGGGGGGNGEHTIDGHAANGATGVKTTSSGYVRIYRLW